MQTFFKDIGCQRRIFKKRRVGDSVSEASLK